MANDFRIASLDEDISKVESIEKNLGELYLDTEFSNVFNRPIIQLLQTACRFMISNLGVIKNRHLAKPLE